MRYGLRYNGAMSHYVYIVECRDNTLYTGYATDVAKRIKEHNSDSGLGAKYTRSRRPVRLLYTEECADRGEAQSREYAIKQLNRTQKMELVNTAKRKKRAESRILSGITEVSQNDMAKGMSHKKETKKPKKVVPKK